MKCTYCESDNVQKCSIIYQSGTTNSKGKIYTSGGGAGIGFGARGFGGFGGGLANSDIHTTSHSDLAIKCSPPSKYIYKAPIILALLASIFFFGFDSFFRYSSYSGLSTMLILGLYIAAGYLAYKGFVFNRDEFPSKLAVGLPHGIVINVGTSMNSSARWHNCFFLPICIRSLVN